MQEASFKSQGIIVADHPLYSYQSSCVIILFRAVFTWLSKGIGFGFGFGFTTPFGWLVYLLWFWFYDSQVKTALCTDIIGRNWMLVTVRV